MVVPLLFVLALVAGCRVQFEELPDARVDARAIDAPVISGVQTLTFGERSGSTFKNVTTDATLYAPLPDSQHGASVAMSIEPQPNTTHCVLRFDLSELPSTVTVEAVRLELVIGDSMDMRAGVLEVAVVAESWVEGTGMGGVGAAGVTWNVRGTGASWATPGGTTTAVAGSVNLGAISGPVELPVPVAVVQQWISDPQTNHGLLLSTPDTGTGHWHPLAHEVVDIEFRPQLAIDVRT